MSNFVSCKGNLVRNVEVRQNEAKEWILFTVAVDRGKDQATDFLDFICFAKQSIGWMKEAKKGNPVYVEGRIEKYIDKEGVNRTQLRATYARPFVWSPKDADEDIDATLEQEDDPEEGYSASDFE